MRIGLTVLLVFVLVGCGKNKHVAGVKKVDDKFFVAAEHSSKLKEGALLIELDDREKFISHYKKTRKDTLYKKVERESKEQMDAIKSGFASGFNFCDYYYFYTKDLKEVINGDYRSVIDGDGNKPTESIGGKDIYICSIGKEKGFDNDSNYKRGEGFYIYEIVEEDDKRSLRILKSPFPGSFTRRWDFRDRKDYYEHIGSRLNEKLSTFHANAEYTMKLHELQVDHR